MAEGAASVRPVVSRGDCLWMGLASSVALALGACVLAVTGTDEKSIGTALRVTARWSFLLFWLAYTGGALAVLFRLTFLARRGREFGLAFAAAHLVHVGLVVWLYRITGHLPLPLPLFIFFGMGLLWIYLLAALSFGRLSRALGRGPWRVLRIAGMNYILLAFANDFVLSVVHSGTAHRGFTWLAEYVPFAAMCVAAPVLSFAATALRHRATRPGGPETSSVRQGAACGIDHATAFPRRKS
jgi:hypothetical protein